MEYVTVEFYFDESKNKSSLDKARGFIMELFNQKGLLCIENNEKNIIFRDICDKYGKFWWAFDNLADNITIVDCLSEAYFIFDDKEDVLNKFLRVVV